MNTIYWLKNEIHWNNWKLSRSEYLILCVFENDSNILYEQERKYAPDLHTERKMFRLYL